MHYISTYFFPYLVRVVYIYMHTYCLYIYIVPFLWVYCCCSCEWAVFIPIIDQCSVNTSLVNFSVQLPWICLRCIYDVSYFGQLHSVFLFQMFPVVLQILHECVPKEKIFRLVCYTRCLFCLS
jgi:hypothetical protein